MKILKPIKLIALTCAVCFAAFVLVPTSAFAEQNQNAEAANMFEITIDGNTRNTEENSVWRGFGFISANNSSRLLLDYKTENPDAYWRILTWLFDPDGGVRMNHIKLELGADIDSSSGTEPSVKRSLDETADVTRGAGFQLAADALTVNPDITLELLSWGAPSFVKNAEDTQDGYEKRYAWFKETLDEAYAVYGLEFDYISPNYNERAVDSEWIKYFAKTLHSETDTPYSYSDIKIVAADEENRFTLAPLMLADKELMDSVDVVGIHYTSTADENTLRLKNEFGKELWYSEGISPANVSEYAVNAGETGIGGVNSMLDVAGRIINMYPNGGYTMYEFQPAVSAYYSGATYYPKQLITANEPWSGYTDVGSGMYLCEHFSLFTRNGWQLVDSACMGDGTDANHVLYDTTNNVMTLADPESDDYSVILANNTSSARSYRFTVKNLDTASQAVQVWETRDPDSTDSAYDSNWFRNTMTVEPEETEDGYVYRITVKPYSLVTVSTLEVQAQNYSSQEENTRLELPYSDDFEYEGYASDYLSSRGYAPRYMTDQGGAFEVEETDGGNILTQQITEADRGVEWAATSEPVTTFGDDTWANYTVGAKLLLADGADDDNYAGVGLRYINASNSNSRSGYLLTVTQTGGWQLGYMNEALAEGTIDGFDASEWHSVSLTAVGDSLSAAVDGVKIASISLDGAVTFSGRAALYSAYNRNSFDDINVLPAEMTGYTVRVDNLDSDVEFSGEWGHNTMDSFTCHNRTASYAQEGAEFTYSFEGDSLALIGTANGAVISVELDGKTVADCETVNSKNKQAFWHRYALGYSEHTVKVTVHSGSLGFDALEYGSISRLKDGGGGLISEENPQSETRAVLKSGTFKAACIGSAAVLAAGGAAYLWYKRRKKRNG